MPPSLSGSGDRQSETEETWAPIAKLLSSNTSAKGELLNVTIDTVKFLRQLRDMTADQRRENDSQIQEMAMVLVDQLDPQIMRWRNDHDVRGHPPSKRAERPTGALRSKSFSTPDGRKSP